MVRNRKNKLFICLLLMVSCLFLASSAFVVQAEDEPVLTNEQIVKQLSERSDIVVETEVFGDLCGIARALPDS